MKQIVLISDTHGDIPEDVCRHLKDADEIWHAGDIGTLAVLEQLQSLVKPIRAVYGNIDGQEVRKETALNAYFESEGVRVLITHIGGYPPRYSKRVKKLIADYQPDLYICGHSHILKVMRDQNHKLLHMNPGACGYKGFHKVRTLLKFRIDKGKVQQLEAVEFKKRWAAKANI